MICLTVMLAELDDALQDILFFFRGLVSVEPAIS